MAILGVNIKAVTLRWVIVTAAASQIALSLYSSGHASELGANKFDLALQYLPPSAVAPEQAAPYNYIRRAMAKKAIADAHDAGLSFLRVAVTGFWPVNFGDKRNDLTLWQADPATFWLVLDEMFDDLDRASLKLVPSFVWNISQFAALGNDTIRTFVRQPQSQSRSLLIQFIREFITRYKDRRTVLFYELTNEMNLQADLNLPKKCMKEDRDNACVWDYFTTNEMVQFSRDLVTLIKSLDPSRLVASGYSIPRPAAMHLMHQPEFSALGADWTPDTPKEFRQYLLLVHEPFDIISVHIYPTMDDNRFGRPEGYQYELVADAASAAKSVGKPLFVGEFGDTGTTPFMIGLLNELVVNQVRYAAIWIWEYYQNSTYRTHDTEATRYSVEPGYSDRLIAELMKTQKALGRRMPSPINPNAPPRVVLTWPVPCAAIEAPLDLAAVASDGSKGAKAVEFLAGGELLASSNQPPYKARFDPAGRGDTAIEIEARALAESGAVASFKSRVKLNRSNAPCEFPP
jgi:hypothetical protein